MYWAESTSDSAQERHGEQLQNSDDAVCLETLLPKKLTGASTENDGFLPRKAIFYYGIGHMLNDLTAACWFTYLLIFLTDIGLSPSDAAMVMLSGQLADGIATIFVGSLIDRFGHYKIWHVGGSILVAISFSSVFGNCWACAMFGTYSEKANTIAYSLFAAIFNIGWAATQVSHMSLVNCLSSNSTTRVALSSCRNACTMIANLCLFGTAYIIFGAFPAKDPSDVEMQYRQIAQISVIIGGCFILIFFTGVKEPRLDHLLSPKSVPRTPFLSWFQKVLYHQVALVYMLTRLATNVSQALLAFYLIDDLQMGDSSKAVVPAVIYVSSFLVSIGLQEMGWTGARIKYFFSVGASLWMISGVFIYFLQSRTQNFVFLLSAIIGVANALMTVTAVSMEGVLVGLDLSGCAFVYASLGFLDKFSCGIALYAIETFHSAKSEGCRSEDLEGPCPHMSTVRITLALVPGSCALLGMCLTFFMDLSAPVSLGHLEQPLLSSADHLKDEVIYSWASDSPEKSSSAVRIPTWRRLACAMVGRWGSPRQHIEVWLD